MAEERLFNGPFARLVLLNGQTVRGKFECCFTGEPPGFPVAFVDEVMQTVVPVTSVLVAFKGELQEDKPF